MNKPGIYFFWTLIIFGLIIRFLLLQYNGVFDLATYYEWGLDTLKNGLGVSYKGVYLPFQYQVFEAGAWIVDKLRLEYFTGYKLLNLIFDAANLLVLNLIFRKLNISLYYLLIYWLHPWFLLMFSQGYCDFQFTFFILCALYITLNGTIRNYLLAGLFLGLAMHMKPQVQVIILASFICGIYLLIKKHDFTIMYIFIFPAIIFLDYSLFFAIHTRNPFEVLRDFFDFPEAMSLTSNFLNAWFPVAYFLRDPDSLIYSVTDDIAFAGIRLRSYALAVLIILILAFITRIMRKRTEVRYHLLLLVTFSSFIFPFIMTEAHENHLFLATVLLVIVYGKIRSIIARILIHIIWLLQFINLYGFYGLGDVRIYDPVNLGQYYANYKIPLILSFIAILAFISLVIYFLGSGADFLARFESIKNIDNQKS